MPPSTLVLILCIQNPGFEKVRSTSHQGFSHRLLGPDHTAHKTLELKQELAPALEAEFSSPALPHENHASAFTGRTWRIGGSPRRTAAESPDSLPSPRPRLSCAHPSLASRAGSAHPNKDRQRGPQQSRPPAPRDQLGARGNFGARQSELSQLCCHVSLNTLRGFLNRLRTQSARLSIIFRADQVPTAQRRHEPKAVLSIPAWQGVSPMLGSGISQVRTYRLSCARSRT